MRAAQHLDLAHVVQVDVRLAVPGVFGGRAAAGQRDIVDIQADRRFARRVDAADQVAFLAGADVDGVQSDHAARKVGEFNRAHFFQRVLAERRDAGGHILQRLHPAALGRGDNDVTVAGFGFGCVVGGSGLGLRHRRLAGDRQRQYRRQSGADGKEFCRVFVECFRHLADPSQFGSILNVGLR